MKQKVISLDKSKDVKYSRAGDAFHYRWAAFRCLKMVYPKSRLQYVVIEGSKAPNAAGECVIDVTEYLGSSDSDIQEIAYYQLKHTIKQREKYFTLGELKDTIVGFSKRYKEHLAKKKESRESLAISFSIVTNRPIAKTFKQEIFALTQGKVINARFLATLKKYTELNEKDLAVFCSLLKLVDGEGDYIAQRYKLHAEIKRLLAGTVDDAQINNIVALVTDKAISEDGTINREEILLRLGATSVSDLYPAPPEFEDLENIVQRKQYQQLRNCILNASAPVIVHAAGGVGKSIFAHLISQSLPEGSLGIVYDCFGGGRHRTRSGLRHRHRDALIQISNELALQELCDPFIPSPTPQDDQIMRGFLARLDTAVGLLKKANKNATLVIFIDAADNAEMAAQEYGDSCFAHELLRETIPDGCHLVALCRTENVDLLRPLGNTIRLELEPFSCEETLLHLRNRFPQATNDDGLEFHRLTNNGNPRVQANALNMGLPTITETLVSLGPSGTTVEQQIEGQLNSAVSVIKERYPDYYQKQIDAICIGLATLPPFIPLRVLAKAADVDETTIRSFLADFGRPIRLYETSVQFNDEPTETWFRQKFSATSDQVTAFIALLEPLASKYPYVAETLPSLYLNAGRYGELIDLALSDNLLPKENPIDERNIRVYRLQFAFKAALKLKNFADATKLALRAGEEVAGDKRQLDLLRKNIDLIAPLQHEQKVQELAFRRLLRSDWEGSENVYSAALLSSVDGFKGEARGFLRAALNWLHIYFETRKKEEKNHSEDRLTNGDITEFANAIFNLEGSEKLVNFLFSWNLPHLTYQIGQNFFRRLIDANNFASIEEISYLDLGDEPLRKQYLMLAMAHEMLEAGRFPDVKATRRCLDLLASKSTRIPSPVYQYKDTTLSALISFIEACAANKLSQTKILRVLNHYVPKRASRLVSDSYITEERDNYLRALALRCVLEKNLEPDLNKLVPREFLENKKRTYRYDQGIREFKERVGALLPWYIVRARLLISEIGELGDAIKGADERSKKVRGQRYRDSDTLPYEISHVLVEILILCQNENTNQKKKFFSDYLKDNKQIWVDDRLKAVRSAFRLAHLSGIRRELELSANDLVASLKDEEPETRAEWYVDIARAVLPASRDDAAVYFDYAIEAVSKFGDELVQRWEAIASLAKRRAEGGYSSPEMAYRFIRCAELVGDNVAREKYWDRSGAIRVCARLSPSSALAALSRWRDRDVGSFYWQIQALADNLVTDNIVSPEVGWSLSAFFEDYDLDAFASLCIAKASSTEHRQYILDVAIRNLRLSDATEKSLRKMKKVAEQHSIRNPELDNALAFYTTCPEKNESIKSPSVNSEHQDAENAIDWASVFDGLELATSDGVSQAIQRFDILPVRVHNHETFWQEIFKRINERDVIKFLEALTMAEHASWYDMKIVRSSLPEDWKGKVSVKRKWGSLLRQVAQRFALDFTSHWGIEYFLGTTRDVEDEIALLREGILKGLSSNVDFVDANMFFGFVEIVSPIISPQQASDLLDLGLARFELHIDNEFADGPWANWLNSPNDIVTAFTGVVWSALGSPRAEIRWRAAHCVRRLAELGCEAETDALVQWMKRDSVDAFGSHRFPFYNLHARQYLLMALARVSTENAQILQRHSTTFSNLALTTTHILIQKFSAQIAINIEKAFPNTYKQKVIKQLHQVGLSQIPVREIDGYREDIESYWHVKGIIDKNLKHLHGWDFDRYWFEPLGRVFGISGKQVEELASEVIINNWHITYDGSFDTDPRSALWRSSRNERETWHDHGTYPRTDNYSFYLSYHAMLTVAAKLIEKMAVVKRRNWDEDDQWADWLQGHTLTRADGRWLADRRDPAPLMLPEWVHQPKGEKWRSEITQNDFLDVILFEHQGKTWLHVYGVWEENNADRIEEQSVHTALVSPLASQSLLNALTACSNPHEYKLPEYQEKDWEFESAPFELKGWIWRGETGRYLDDYDPFASQIPYPPYRVGDSVIEKLGLSVDAEQRNWFLSNADKASLVCELWSTNKSRTDEDPLRRGERLSASLDFLQKLCLVQKCEIVFEVQIGRRFRYNSYTGNKGDNEYKPPLTKIYILSADGNLRDTETHYQIR